MLLTRKTTCSEIEKRLISWFVLRRLGGSRKILHTKYKNKYWQYFSGYILLRWSNAIALVSAKLQVLLDFLVATPRLCFVGEWSEIIKIQKLDNGCTYKSDYHLISSFGRAPVSIHAEREVTISNPAGRNNNTKGIWITEKKLLPLRWHLQTVRLSSLFQ